MVANDKVFFNGKAASISTASATEITATVPLGAGTGNVTLSVDNGALVKGPVFTYQLSEVVSTFAGSDAKGSLNGVGPLASFNAPLGMAVDGAGNVYVADSGNNLIRKISPAGVVTTLAGSGAFGSANGLGTSASFNTPTGVAVDGAGNVYVADGGNSLIRKISVGGMVSTLAGSGTRGTVDGTGASATFSNLIAIAADAAGNVYVVDGYANNLTRKVSSGGVVTTLASLSTSTNNGAASDLAVDAAGNIYLTTTSAVRKISPGGVVSTFAGILQSNVSPFSALNAIAVDAAGNVYVTDFGNESVSKISIDGVVTIIAGGNGERSSINGPAFSASFSGPFGIAADAVGNVYVSDTLIPNPNMIRKIVLE